MFFDLIVNALHSSFAAYVGVGAIFVYFVVIIATALYRIKKADHMHH